MLSDNHPSSLWLDATQNEAPEPEAEQEREGNADLSVEPEARQTLFFDRFAETKITEKHLPHWKQDGKLYFVTWRQADSIPRKKRDQLKRERDAWFQHHGGMKRQDLPLGTRMEYYRLFDARVQQWLDAGYGSCVLKHPGAETDHGRCAAPLQQHALSIGVIRHCGKPCACAGGAHARH